jgi:hypothetical protein
MQEFITVLLNIDWTTVWVAFASVITGATMLVKGLRVIAGLTPTTKDDTVLDVIISFLEKIANLELFGKKKV